MIKGQRVIAIIPARAGSKGIKGKNLIKIGKYSLLERSILLAKNCAEFIEEIIVTTDSPQMHEIALKYGVAAPTIRPSELASDFTRSIDVLIHIIKQCHLENDYILMLQPTSPLRTTTDLRAVVDLFQNNQGTCDAVASVTPLRSTHPDKIQFVAKGYLTTYIPGVVAERPRQELPLVYSLNGAFYLTHAQTILTKRTLLPQRTLPFVMPKEHSINLDHAWDMVLLEVLLSKGLVVLEEYA